MTTKPAGYSAAPLFKKLGIAANSRVVARHAPDDYARWLAPLPAGVVFEAAVSPTTDVVHVFARDRASLKAELQALRAALRPDAAVWVSWPKKTAKMPTDITENTIRELALPLGFVDIKVCAVNEVWSGLKLVIRKGLR
jgi:hypothetical protein